MIQKSLSPVATSRIFSVAGQLDQRGVAHLRADTHDVVGVVLDEAGGLLAVGHGRGQAKQERDDG